MSKLEYHHKNDEFEVWLYTPDIIHAFPFYMENVGLSWRIRCILEFFVGYSVYYIKINEKWAGYCVISNGRNPRYSFATDKDIIFGRYFIDEEFRGDGLAVRMLREILDNSGLIYDKAFAYLRCTNIASKKSIERLGGKRIKRFDIRGFTRKLYDSDNGEFVLYCYTLGGKPK